MYRSLIDFDKPIVIKNSISHFVAISIRETQFICHYKFLDWPTKSLVDKLIKESVVRAEELRQFLFCSSLQRWFWSSFGLRQAFVFLASPHTFFSHISSAVISFCTVEKEGISIDSVRNLQEILHFFRFLPRRFDKIISIYNMNLVSWEVLEPSLHMFMI